LRWGGELTPWTATQASDSGRKSARRATTANTERKVAAGKTGTKEASKLSGSGQEIHSEAVDPATGEQ